MIHSRDFFFFLQFYFTFSSRCVSFEKTLVEFSFIDVCLIVRPGRIKKNGHFVLTFVAFDRRFLLLLVIVIIVVVVVVVLPLFLLQVPLVSAELRNAQGAFREVICRLGHARTQ